MCKWFGEHNAIYEMRLANTLAEKKVFSSHPPQQFTLIVNDDAFTFFYDVYMLFWLGKVVMLQEVALFLKAAQSEPSTK